MRTALELQGRTNLAAVYHNLPTPFLCEEIVRRREGRLAHLGPLVVRTGHHTDRAPNDKFVVREPSSEEKVWWGPSNQPLSPERFEALRQRMLAYLQGNDLFVQDCFLCAVRTSRLSVRVRDHSAKHRLLRWPVVPRLYAVPRGVRLGHGALRSAARDGLLCAGAADRRDDVQQGTTAEGIHLGAMAGTVDLVQRVSTGIEVRGDVLRLTPELPQMERLDMRIRYRGHSLDLRLTRASLTIRGRDGTVPPITLCVDGEVCEFVSGTTRVFGLNDDATHIET